MHVHALVLNGVLARLFVGIPGQATIEMEDRAANALTRRRVRRGGENQAGETCVLVGGQLAQLLKRVPLGQYQRSQAPARAEGPESPW